MAGSVIHDIPGVPATCGNNIAARTMRIFMHAYAVNATRLIAGAKQSPPRHNHILPINGAPGHAVAPILH